jgi:hypothetical protein
MIKKKTRDKPEKNDIVFLMQLGIMQARLNDGLLEQPVKFMQKEGHGFMELKGDLPPLPYMISSVKTPPDVGRV